MHPTRFSDWPKPCRAHDIMDSSGQDPHNPMEAELGDVQHGSDAAAWNRERNRDDGNTTIPGWYTGLEPRVFLVVPSLAAPPVLTVYVPDGSHGVCAEART